MYMKVIIVTIVIPLEVLVSSKCSSEASGIRISLAALALCNLGCFVCTACRDPGLVLRIYDFNSVFYTFFRGKNARKLLTFYL